MVNWYRAAVLLVALIGAWAMLSLAFSAPRRIDILFAPSIITDQESVTIEVWVTAKPEHRWLIIMACDRESCVRRSDVNLEGAETAQVHRIEWRSGLPAGDLLVVASVHSTSRELARATRLLKVIPTHG